MGKNAQRRVRGARPRRHREARAAPTWTVVGVIDAGGSAFDSEIWCDADLLNSTYQRPAGHLPVGDRCASTSRDALAALQRRVAADPRMRVQVERETEYYAKASQMMTTLILRPGLAGGRWSWALGAVFAALNTMYSAVAERSREIATIRALGFGGGGGGRLLRARGAAGGAGGRPARLPGRRCP